MKNKNILISGAGIAGLTLAYWLRQRGFTPTVVEKHPTLRKGGYKVDVRGTALEVAKRMGIYEDLTCQNVNIKRATFVTPDLRVFELEGDLLGFCSEGDVEVNRFDLAHILAKAVSGIEILYDDSIVKIDYKVVHFEKRAPREFDLVIGADGIYSQVRRLVFGEDPQFIKEHGVRFCLFPIPNIFELDRSELVYFNKGAFVAAYAVNNHSYACLAFKTTKENSKELFEEHFKHADWEIPRLIRIMKESNECYFGTTSQVRMSSWSKGRVALVGDAAYSAQGIGTSMAIVGAYVLAEELEKAPGEYAAAFANYETRLRKFVEQGQKISEANHAMIAHSDSSRLIKLQLYIMQLLPGKCIRLFTALGRRKMRKAANAIIL